MSEQDFWRNRIVDTGAANPQELAKGMNPLNWRGHPEAQREALEEALDSVGWLQRVLVNRSSGQVIDGHLRIELAVLKGQPLIPVDYVELTDDEEALALATLDAITEQAQPIPEKLAALLERTRAIVADKPGLAGMLDALKARAGVNGQGQAGNDAEPQIDKAQQLKEKWGVEYGQVWELPSLVEGKPHRIVCGDCTDKVTVERVMGGMVFRLCITSPPYTDQREYKIGDFDWLTLANGFIDCVFTFASSNADILVNLGLSHKNGRVDRYYEKWLDHCEDTHPLYGWYIWDKGSGFPGEWNGRLAPSHEFVFHFSNGHVSANKWIETTGESEKRGTSGKRFRQKDGSLKEIYSPDKVGQLYKIPDSVIRITREMARGLHTQAHPAVFSVEFAGFFVNTWSTSGDVIFDPFLGSGTTLMAAHNLGRICYGCEIDTGYVSVILERYHEATGLTPTLVSG